jgi:hypothetical protein
MEEREIWVTLNQHWAASAPADNKTGHEIHAGHVVREYPHSGERIVGRRNFEALHSRAMRIHPTTPS